LVLPGAGWGDAERLAGYQWEMVLPGPGWQNGNQGDCAHSQSGRCVAVSRIGEIKYIGNGRWGWGMPVEHRGLESFEKNQIV